MHDSAGPFCPACALGLEELGLPRCRICAEPGHFHEDTCPRCQAKPPPFVRAVAPYHHDGPLARAIHRFKYEDHPELARPLGGMLADAVSGAVLGGGASDIGPSADRNHPERSPSALLRAGSAKSRGTRRPDTDAAAFALCAIPLHKSRYAQRLYDQAELLASEVSKATGLELLGALERTRATTRQVGLTEAEREANVAGAFRAVADVKGRHLLLVDDVLTTGATARAAAGALREAGAAEIVVVALARASSEPG